MQRDYKEIMQTISFHKDFGKRNPIDIGIELGYSEREIEEMLRLMSVGEIPDDKSQVNDSQVGETVEEIRKYKKNSISEKIENSSCLYYDGRDICKKCADIIGINEYVELDKYLITSDENNNLIKIEKETGEKESIELKADIKKCKGWGNWIYFYHSNYKVTDLYRFNIESSLIEQIYIEKEISEDFQVNDRYLVFRYENGAKQIMCCDMNNRTTQVIETSKGEPYSEKFYLVGEKIYCNLYYQLHVYDLKEKKDTILQEEIDDEAGFAFLGAASSIIGGCTGYFANKLYTAPRMIGGDENKQGIFLCDVNHPGAIQIIHFPGYGKKIVKGGYGKICYVTEDEDAILSCYDIVTNTKKVIMENFPAVSCFEQGRLIKKKSYFCDTSRMQIVGRWLYYRDASGPFGSFESTVENVRLE